MSEPAPSVIATCARCGEDVEVFGAVSLVREPFVCVQCLDPRHKPKEGDA